MCSKEKELEKMSMLALNRKKDKARDMREKKKTVIENKIEKSILGQLVIGLKLFPSDFMLDLVESKTSSKC